MEVLLISGILFSLFTAYTGNENFNFTCKFLGVLFFIFMMLNAADNILFLAYSNPASIEIKNDLINSNSLSIFINMSLFYLLWMISKRKFSKKTKIIISIISGFICIFSGIISYVKILIWIW